MILSEEYRKRHSIVCPLVKIADNMSMIFSADPKIWGNRLIVFEVKKYTKEGRPPFPYHINYLEPVKDEGFSSINVVNYGGNNMNMKAISNKEVTFDTFEVDIINFAKGANGLEPIYDLAKAKMAAWEMFLFCNQSRLNQLPVRLEESLYITIGEDSIDVKTKAMEKIIAEGLPRTSLNGKWDLFKNYANPFTYADWFGKLVQDARENKDFHSFYSDIRNLA